MIDQSEILQYFEFHHLPVRLQPVSAQFRELAWQIETILPKGPEKSVALRKLLESKDAAVRSALALPDGPVYRPQTPEPGDMLRQTATAFAADRSPADEPAHPGRAGWPTPGGLHAGDTSEWRGAQTEHPTPSQTAAEWETSGVTDADRARDDQ